MSGRADTVFVRLQARIDASERLNIRTIRLESMLQVIYQARIWRVCQVVRVLDPHEMFDLVVEALGIKRPLLVCHFEQPHSFSSCPA
ncbi:MAG TPA: hypothetical protein VFU63_03240 [Ktedonobacterales bacterium]|nr:hypothetical protein [Ktedonobacterales bacterium]